MTEVQVEELVFKVTQYLKFAQDDFERYETKGKNFEFMLEHSEGKVRAYQNVLDLINEIKGEDVKL